MQPIPIPEATIKKGEPLGWVHRVIAGPDGDLTGEVRPVEALIGMVACSDGEIRPELNVLCIIEPMDMLNLAAGGMRFWLTFTGHIVPFSFQIFDPEGDEVDAD